MFGYFVYLNAFLGLIVLLLLGISFFNVNKHYKLYAYFVLTMCLFFFIINSASFYGRVVIWKILILKGTFSLLGNGYNNFAELYGNYKYQYFQNHFSKKEILLVDNSPHCYNEFIEFVFDFGYFGLVGLIVIIILFVIVLLRFKKKQLREILPAVYSLSVITFYSNFHFVLHNFYIVLALIFNISFVCLYFVYVNKYIKTLWCFIAFILLLISIFINNANKYFNLNENINYQLSTCQINALNINENSLNSTQVLIYSHCLMETKQILDAENVLFRYSSNYLDYNVLIRLGDLHFIKKDYKKATENYEKAVFVLPNRFLPLFKQFKVYELLNDTINKKKLRNLINTKQVKLESKELEYYKEYINIH